mmetsp:Transcript_6154/g.8900  ORF Transcript_6154/g.8900 Transcript_6154/m.8900 type:complete len:151 (-) Transcript_6154:1451-1903(-)
MGSPVPYVALASSDVTEEEDIDHASDQNHQDDQPPTPRGRGNRRSKKSSGNCKKDRHAETKTLIPREQFQGRCEDLKGYTYDSVLSKGGMVYTKTTAEIAQHVNTKYNQIGTYLRTALLTSNIPAVPQPVAPTPEADGNEKETQREIYKE